MFQSRPIRPLRNPPPCHSYVGFVDFSRAGTVDDDGRTWQRDRRRLQTGGNPRVCARRGDANDVATVLRRERTRGRLRLRTPCFAVPLVFHAALSHGLPSMRSPLLTPAFATLQMMRKRGFPERTCYLKRFFCQQGLLALTDAACYPCESYSFLWTVRANFDSSGAGKKYDLPPLEWTYLKQPRDFPAHQEIS